MKTDIEASLVLDVLEIGTLFDIMRSGDLWFGEWHAITWEPMRSTCIALTELSARICDRPAAEFVLREYLRPVGKQARVGANIAFVGRNAPEETQLAIRDAAALHFLELVGFSRDIDNHVLAFRDTLTPEVEASTAASAREFLEKQGGRKIPMAINAQIGESKTEIQLRDRLASKPVQQVPEADKVIKGFIEGFDRPDRSCRIVRLDGGESLFVKFKIETELARLREVACNDRCYVISLSDVLDAKGRAGTIITRVDALPDSQAEIGSLQLQPSRQGSRRSPVPRCTEPQ